jgi:hypothetical protein
MMEHSETYTIRELTPELLDDYLSFFDHDAFADHPEWGFCYCRLHHFPHAQRDWRETTGCENREAVIDLILNGVLRGFLAYSENKPVGWCNAGPRVRMTTTPDYEEPDADVIGSIMCFVIAKNTEDAASHASCWKQRAQDSWPRDSRSRKHICLRASRVMQ